MQVLTVGQQATLDGEVVTVKRLKLDRSLGDLRLIVNRAQVPCSWCDKLILPRMKGGYWLGRRWAEHYDSPWDDIPRVDLYCSEECHEHSEDSYWGSFTYQRCDSCERHIVERCPSNGWHEYFRYDMDTSEAICLRCYEESVLADGQPETDFDGDSSVKGGMFFDHGNPELVAVGYGRLEEAFIQSGASALDYNAKARAYIEQGYQLVTAFESMAIGGLEGYIELWGKKKQEGENNE